MLSTGRYSLVLLLSITVFTYVHAETVGVQVYYESLCPDCKQFDSQQLVPLITKLGTYVKVKTIPYGNAKTFVGPDGRVTFHCQHGPAECYGNKLHACAIDLIGNVNTAIIFNTCMMDRSQRGQGSDDAAADICGWSMQIDSANIKQCAKSPRGDVLLKYYGELSKQAQFTSVPHILVNGRKVDGTNLMRDVCSAFMYPPSECYIIY